LFCCFVNRFLKNIKKNSKPSKCDDLLFY